MMYKYSGDVLKYVYEKSIFSRDFSPVFIDYRAFFFLNTAGKRGRVTNITFND